MEKRRLSPWFVTGLVEGEGCFSISFSLRRKLKLGIEVRPSFSLSLNERDLELLKEVHAFFDCGAIRYSKNDRTYKYEARSVEDLVKEINPHFHGHPLQGAKAKDWKIFEKLCKEIHANLHLSRKHLPRIIEDAYRMNPSGTRRHDKQTLLRMLDEIKV